MNCPHPFVIASEAKQSGVAPTGSLRRYAARNDELGVQSDLRNRARKVPLLALKSVTLATLTMAAAQVPVGGFYRAHQMEVGAALLLQPDGQFRYQLDYGAVSESAEGNWIRRSDIILLTSTRMEGNMEKPFEQERLAIEGDSLFLRRYDMQIRFVRETNRPIGDEEDNGD